MELLCCKKCGEDAETCFSDVLDLHVTAHAMIQCSACENDSASFELPNDQSIGNDEMGILIERLAKLHWNMINDT